MDNGRRSNGSGLIPRKTRADGTRVMTIGLLVFGKYY